MGFPSNIVVIALAFGAAIYGYAQSPSYECNTTIRGSTTIDEVQSFINQTKTSPLILCFAPDAIVSPGQKSTLVISRDQVSLIGLSGSQAPRLSCLDSKHCSRQPLVMIQKAHGVRIENLQIESTGSQSTSLLIDNSVDVSLTRLDISSTGQTSIALAAVSTENIGVDLSKIRSRGFDAYGVYFISTTDGIVSNSRVETSGNGAFAFLATTGSSFSLSTSFFRTTGEAAHALLFNNSHAREIRKVIVETQGPFASGIESFGVGANDTSHIGRLSDSEILSKNFASVGINLIRSNIASIFHTVITAGNRESKALALKDSVVTRISDSVLTISYDSMSIHLEKITRDTTVQTMENVFLKRHDDRSIQPRRDEPALSVANNARFEMKVPVTILFCKDPGTPTWLKTNDPELSNLLSGVVVRDCL